MTTAGSAPSWLLEREVGLCPCGCIGKRKKRSFVEKTIGGASGLMRQAMFSEDMAAQPGLLQRIEPRIKLLTLLGLLVSAVFAAPCNVPATWSAPAIDVRAAVAWCGFRCVTRWPICAL